VSMGEPRFTNLDEAVTFFKALNAKYARGHAIEAAQVRLQNAALRIGDLFAAEIDPGWDECQEIEAAALEYRNVVRAAEAKDGAR
jgi:hypothetical protein